MLKQLLLIFFLVIELIAKGSNPLVTIKNNMDSSHVSDSWINQSSIVYDSITKNHFSRTDSLNIYGLGYKGNFPDTCLNRNLLIEIRKKVRFASIHSEFGIALSISIGDSTIFWDSKNVEIKTIGEWSEIVIDYKIPASLVTKNNTLLIYGWNRNRKFVCDFDEVEINFNELIDKSFVPDNYNIFNYMNFYGAFNKRIYGSLFSIDFNAEKDRIGVVSKDGDNIINDINVFLEYTKSKSDKKSKKLILGKYEELTVEQDGEVLKVHISFPSKIAKVNIELICNNLTGTVSIDSKVVFNSNVYVQRCAIAIEYGIDIGRVLTKNSLIDSVKIYKEYWLGKEGVLFSGKVNNYLIYRNQLGTSLQLTGLSCNLLLNLDLNLDHPMLHFPPLKKSSASYRNRSNEYYKKGQELKGGLKFRTVEKNQEILRVLKNPNGYLASMIWTEHADFSDIRIQRAINFGRENIHAADSAVGGFIGHGIPVTKSVFYDNPTHLKNAEKDARFPGESISIKGSAEFVDLLKQLYKKKQEICLHTPDPFSTNRALAMEAMDYMQKNFGAVNWIDHGYDNAPSSNREDIVCSGLDSTSEFYMGDLWKKYGVKYFWNNFYEDSGLYANSSFYSFFTTPYSGWDQTYPTPEYFRNPLDRNFISWRTTFTLDPADGSLWNYYFNEQRLNDLVQSRGNCILHCYPARVDSTTGFYSYSGNTIVVNPEFDIILKRLKEYGDQGKIWLTTVKEMLDYRLKLESVVVEAGRSNSMIVFNNSDVAISGLSLVTEAKGISAGEKNVRIKDIGNERIVILDLAPHEKLILQLN